MFKHDDDFWPGILDSASPFTPPPPGPNNYIDRDENPYVDRDGNNYIPRL